MVKVKLPSRETPEEIEAYKKGKVDTAFPVRKPIATFVKDKDVAERMLAGARRRLNAMPKLQAELRVHGVKVSLNKAKGAIRGAKRRARRKSFKGSEGFEGSARATQKSSGPSAKAVARQRAREFNVEYGGNHGAKDQAADS